MLPISSKKTLSVTTEDGTVVELSYLLGKMQMDYMKIIDIMSAGNKLIKKAERIEKKNLDLESESCIEEKEIYDGYLAKAQQILGQYRCDLVDLFVIKIGETEVRKPSSELPIEDISELATLIQNNFAVLTGQKKAEVKN